MKNFKVEQTVVSTLTYIVEAKSKKEALALVNGGQVPEAWDLGQEILKVVVEEIPGKSE